MSYRYADINKNQIYTGGTLLKKNRKIVKNLSLLVIIAVIITVAINKIINFFANARENLPVGNGSFYTWRYGNIYYIKKGKGAPVLLVHDMHPASSAYEWNKVINQLARTNTVYAIDLLGCGRSDKPNLTYTNYMYVQLVNDFIKNVIGSPAHIVTTGSSISFTVMACQLTPENFRKIIGISPADLYELAQTPTKKSNILKYVMEVPVLGSLIYNILMSRNAILDMLIDEYYFKDYLISNETRLSYYQSAHLKDGNGKYLLSSMHSHYTTINIVPALRKINNSISLIGGKEHEYINDIIDEYIKYNPAIEAAYIPDSKYLPQMENPDKLVELIKIIIHPE